MLDPTGTQRSQKRVDENDREGGGKLEGKKFNWENKQEEIEVRSRTLRRKI